MNLSNYPICFSEYGWGYSFFADLRGIERFAYCAARILENFAMLLVELSTRENNNLFHHLDE